MERLLIWGTIVAVCAVLWHTIDVTPKVTNVTVVACPAEMGHQPGTICETRGFQARAGGQVSLESWEYARLTIFGKAAVRELEDLSLIDPDGTRPNTTTTLIEGDYTVVIAPGSSEARIGIEDPVWSDPHPVWLQMLAYRPVASP